MKETSKPVVDDPDNIPDGPEETQDDNNQSEVRKVVQDKSESVTSEDDEQKVIGWVCWLVRSIGCC